MYIQKQIKLKFIFMMFLWLLVVPNTSFATIYFYFDAEDGTVGNILPNPPICSLPCSGSKVESDGTYQSSGGAPQGSKYFQWQTYDTQPNAYTEIHPSPVFPITNVIGKTYYLAYFFNFTRINGLDIWYETGQSADKGIEIVGDGIRWLISRGAWSTLASNQDHHYTVWTGNPTYHLNLALEHGDIYYPNQNGYSNTNTLQLQYERWYAAVMVIKIAADNTGSIAFYIDGVKISEYNNIITAANNSPTITDIKMGGSIAQPAYDAPAHYRKFDALMLTDNWQDVVNGGYLGSGGGNTPPPSSGGNTSSSSDSSSSGGSGCGFVKDDNGKGPRAKGEGLSFAIMLIIALTGIALAKRTGNITATKEGVLVMNTRKISIIKIAAISFLLTIFWSVSAYAQPNITSFSGSLTDGSTITINGNSFGANGPNIVVFDDFEGGTNGNDINSGAGSATIGKWDRIGQVACKPKYDNAFSVSGSKSFKADYTIKTNTGTDAGCSAFIDNLNTGYIFLSYWFYLPTTSAFPCYNGGICNWKPAWLYGTNTQDDDQVIPAGFGGTTESLAEWAIFGNDTYPYPWPWNYFTFNMNKGNWYRIWAYIHATNDATGTKELWVMSTNASIPVTKKLDYSNMQIFNDTDSQFEIFSFSAWARWCNNCTESAPRFDDVYLATGPNARARIEIGNSATYNTCTNLTIATVTSWSDTSITATIRQGSFSNLNNAYLYVIDANGNVNTNGYLLSDGGGGGTGGDTPPPSSSSGGDSGGGSGGSGCGFVKEINGKGQGAKGEMLSFAIMLIITLAGIALVRKAAVYKGSKGVEHIKRMTYLSLLFFVIFCIPAFANAADYYVATNGNDTNPGTIEQPFRTTLKGLQSVKNGDIIYIRGGAYRLMEESTTTEGFAKPNATQTSFVTIQNYNNEKVRILGSVSSAGQTWVKYNPDIWQIPADFMPNDPKGMFNGEKRIAHVMKWIGGVRSHGDISQLTNPGQWTKADATGNGCTDNNANCNIYLFPNTGEDPNTQSYELSQRMFFWGGSSYMIVRGLEFAYTQNAAFTIEGGRGQIIENNIFSHNSNGNDNAYSVFISYGGGAVIRNNKAFDSEYWGGTPNSKGITLMCMDPNDPSMIEGNEIYDIIGQGIATKSGVSNIIVRRNYVHNVGSGIEPPGPRCHWTKPDCQKGDSEYYPGGGWQIYENTLVNNTNAISIKGSSEAGDASHNNKIYNNVFYKNTTSAIDLVYAPTGTVIANNIFLENARGVYPDNGGSGISRIILDFLPNFNSDYNLFFNNTADYFLRKDWTGPSDSGTGFSLDQIKNTYSRELNSLSSDPLFVEKTSIDFHLQPASPAKNAGNGSFYNAAKVDLGIYPNPSALNTAPTTYGSDGTSGGSGCGFVRDSNNKGPRAKGEGLSFAMMLIIILAGIALAKRRTKNITATREAVLVMDIRKISLIKITAISFLLTIFWSASAFAQPNITGFSGSLADGSTITINGNSFGANGPNVVIFDDFESGTNGSNIATGTGSATVGKWDAIGGGSGACLPKYDSTFAHSGGKSYKTDYTIKTNTGTDANCSAYVYNLNTGDAFLSYWVYLPTSSIFPCYGGIGSTDCNWKMAWLYGINTGYDDQVIPVGLPGGTTPPYSSWALSCNGCYGGTTNWFTLNMQKGKWYRIWAWIHGTTDTTGHKDTWVMSKDDNIPVTQKVNWNGQVFNTGGYFRNFAISAWARWCYNCTESAPRFDDVYLATGPNARARIEIGNSATYNTCTNLTIATVTSWSDTSIQATVRQGSFGNFNNAYLYVIDANGNVNTNGYLLSDGGGGGGGNTPPLSSSSDSSSSGGSGCGYIKNDDGKGQGAKGEGLAFAIMLTITLIIVYLIRRGKIIQRFLL